jgi:cytochrome c-type biogenesis protein CcmH/NrfG
MRAASAVFLILGTGVGFFGMFKYISPRAADIVKPIPQFVPQGSTPSAQVDPALVKQLEDTLEKDPKNFDALRELGNIRYDERKFAEAASIYAKALEVQPDNADVRSDRGGALLQSNRVDEAINELKTALSKNPTHPQALFIMGIALSQGKGDREGAIAAWKKLVDSHPELPELDVVRQQIKQLEEQPRRK